MIVIRYLGSLFCFLRGKQGDDVEREPRRRPEELTHLLRGGVVDPVPDDRRRRVIRKQAEIPHGRSRPATVREQLGELRHFRIEDLRSVPGVRRSLERSGLFDQILKRQLRPPLTCAHICPDLGSLLEIHAADVADDRGANVEPARSFRLCRVLRLDSTIASKQENWHAVRKRNQFQTHSTLQRSKFLTGRWRKHESIQKEKTRT